MVLDKKIEVIGWTNTPRDQLLGKVTQLAWFGRLNKGWVRRNKFTCYVKKYWGESCKCKRAETFDLKVTASDQWKSALEE